MKLGSPSSGVGAAYILVSFEVWLRHHLQEACLILPGLGTFQSCLVAGWWVSEGGRELPGCGDRVMLIWVNGPPHFLAACLAQCLVYGHESG